MTLAPFGPHIARPLSRACIAWDGWSRVRGDDEKRGFMMPNSATARGWISQIKGRDGNRFTRKEKKRKMNLIVSQVAVKGAMVSHGLLISKLQARPLVLPYQRWPFCVSSMPWPRAEITLSETAEHEIITRAWQVSLSFTAVHALPLSLSTSALTVTFWFRVKRRDGWQDERVQLTGPLLTEKQGRPLAGWFCCICIIKQAPVSTYTPLVQSRA